MEQIKIQFNLNGNDVSVTADPNKRLVDFLREDMGMTSVKEGCGEGECGPAPSFTTARPSHPA